MAYINGKEVLFSSTMVTTEGLSVEVDQTFNPNSENAQSGKAVAEALATVKVDLSGYYTKEETDAIVGDIETLLGGI